jgi:hypothetical protein
VVERDATRMCALLVGLEDVCVLGVEDGGDGTPLMVHVESTARRSGCPECGLFGWSKDRPKVTLVDLPCFGRPTRLVWHKHRLCCPDGCSRSWTVEVLSVAPPRQALTTRAGKGAVALTDPRGAGGPPVEPPAALTRVICRRSLGSDPPRRSFYT